MTLDQVENFVRVSVAGTHDSGVSTVTLESGEASELPLVTDGKYNLVWFDASGFAQPDADPNVEIVRVNSINTNNDTISVTRGVENTSASAKNTGTEYELLLTPTAKTIEDIDANKLDTTQRYTDGEAVSAISGEVIEPEQSIQSKSIESNLLLSSDDSLILTGPVTGTGSISGNGKFFVPGVNPDLTEFLKTGDPIDANTLDGINSSGFVQTSDSIDADTLDGKNASEFVQTGDPIDANKLDGINASGFVQTSDSINADTLDGKNASEFVQTGDSIDADTLDGKSSTDFVATDDPINADTLDGVGSTGFIQSGDTIDADTLDGLDASQLGIDVSNDASTVITNATDINFGSGLTALDDTDGTSTVSVDPFSHESLTNIDTDDHHTRYSDSEAISAINNESSLSVDITGDAETLDGIDSSGFVKTTDPVDANTLDGTNASGFVKTTDSIDADTLDGKDSTDFVETSASIDADTFDGKDSTAFVETSDSIDADTVDGFDATDLARPKNIAVLTSTDTSTDISTNSNVPIRFNKELQIDAGFSHSESTNPEQLTFNDAGTYKIIVSLSFSGTGSRVNPSIRLSLNGNLLDPRGASGYIRNASGHDESSSDVFEVLSVSSGDVLRVETTRYADSGTVTLRSNESRLIVEQLSETVALSGDADTLDGKHSTDFIETSDTIDADTLDGKDSSDFVEASDFPNLEFDGTTVDSSDTINFIPE
jgi:hypothetical protein